MATLTPRGLSFDDTRSLVRDALRSNHPGASYVWIDNIYGDMVVYSVETEGQASSKYSSSYSIDSENAVTFGDATKVITKQVYETVAEFGFTAPTFDEADFAASTSEEIIKPCLIFRCGQYPEKGLPSYTRADADAILIPAIGDFGLRIEDQHPRKDPVTGEVIPNKWSGKLGRGGLKAWRVGDDVFANVSFSRLVAEAFKGEKPNLSISIDTATKKPIELSLVDQGHITGASVLSEFSTEKTEGSPVRKRRPMSFFGTLAEKLGLKESEVKEGIKAEFSNENSELEARLKAVEAENQALKQGQSSFSATTVHHQALQIADSVIHAGKAFPAERDALIAQFSGLLTADASSGKIAEFGTDGKLEYGPLTKSALDREMARAAVGTLVGDFSVQSGGGSNEASAEIDYTGIYELHNGGGAK